MQDIDFRTDYFVYLFMLYIGSSSIGVKNINLQIGSSQGGEICTNLYFELAFYDHICYQMIIKDAKKKLTELPKRDDEKIEYLNLVDP